MYFLVLKEISFFRQRNNAVKDNFQFVYFTLLIFTIAVCIFTI